MMPTGLVQLRAAGAQGARANPHMAGSGQACGSCGSTDSQLVQTANGVTCMGQCEVDGSTSYADPFVVCQPRVRLTCASKRLFIVNPDDRLVYFFDDSCDIEADPSPGGCPTSSGKLFQDPCQDQVRVDLPDGTYANINGVWTKVDPCCTCVKRAIHYDAEGAAFFFVPPVDVLDVAETVTLCPQA